ncbi:NAD-dependent epimerase/dehydratase family protein [Streptomyces mobaraensis]|uniref:NAD-dependent epimerase/dehydratase family protein n=1 Tax=Streptomyces mobaraensis TaxID=35621 RepID=A0A5N5W1N7_STRMB|nr:NAD-dependent epimerase/dehydratase family protein [Streptomyces mobaraensis]
MRVLVVGGTGFLGYHVVRELVARGHEVTVAVRRPGTTVAAPDVTLRMIDVTDPGRLPDLVEHHDGLVFAAGADDRAVPPAPAYYYFEARNVEPVRRLMAAAARTGCARAVVLGSYFTTLHRQWPQLGLPVSHPYIRSRVEQARAAEEAAGDRTAVTVLEIPFTFGATPGRPSLWAPLARWMRSPLPLMAPPGGTAVVTTRTVARAAVGALEQRASGPYPVVDENVSWERLLARLAQAAGRPRPVHRLPPALLRSAAAPAAFLHAARGREPGLRPAALPALLTRELFLDPTACRTLTGEPPPSVDEALAATLRGCAVGS